MAAIQRDGRSRLAPLPLVVRQKLTLMSVIPLTPLLLGQGTVMMKRKTLVLFFAILVKSDIISRQEFALY